MTAITESIVEQATLGWFEALGYTITGGPSIAPGEPGQERRTYAEVVLEGRLRDALAVPHEDAIRIRDDVGFFQAVRTAIAKTQVGRTQRARAISTTPSGRSSRRRSWLIGGPFHGTGAIEAWARRTTPITDAGRTALLNARQE